MEPVSTGVAAVATGIQAAKVAKKYAETANDFWGRLEPTLRGKIRAKVEKHFKDFSAYLNATNEKTSNVQLICSRSVNSKLEDVYVNCNFKDRSDSSKVVTDLKVIKSISDGKRHIIRGNGGSGKTLFMKNLWRHTYTDPKGKIPIFIELRKFNDMADVDIIGLIRNTLSPTVSLTDQLFQEMASSGTFLIIFDGFDEVSVDKREAVEKQLLRFEQQFMKCSIALSSRPNETFIGWKSFSILDILPLNREQVLAVVEKTPLKNSTKAAFKKLLTKKFFDDHSDFLTSPLLALMMLVTFKQKGDISDNLIDFYDNAFHALYSEHDTTKESYKRPHCLGINEFKLVFSTFCLFTYHQEKFELKQSEILEFIQRSLDHVNLTRDSDAKIKCKAEEFLHEVSDAVNLMTKDGMVYVFVHRSFQEYFAAYWVIFVDTKRTEATLEEFAVRPYDNLMLLAYKMNKLKVDDAYVLSMYDRLVASDLILKAKPKEKTRWQYIANYQLKVSWRSTKMLTGPDAKKKVNVFYPSWDNGEVGVYYTVIDTLVFKQRLRERFFDVIGPQSHGCRPNHLLGLISADDITSLSVSITTDGKTIFPKIRGFKNGERSEIEGERFFKDEKFIAKVEDAFDEIENMLHDLNKSINGHVTSVREGHSKSLKSLDEMFFS